VGREEMQIKDVTSNTDMSHKASEDGGVMSDIRYICKSCSLITESLQKGCDVMQLANGDIIITEMKPITFQYSWDEKKGKLVRSQVASKHRKFKSRQHSAEMESEDDEVFETEVV
jgi:hypothetical protein